MKLFRKSPTEAKQVGEPEQILGEVEAHELRRLPLVVKSKYTDLAYEDYNRILQPLVQKVKDLQLKSKDISERIQQEQGANRDRLIEVQQTLIKQRKAAQLELDRARAEYKPDFNLVALAEKLDRLERCNEGARLTMQLHNQLKGLVPNIKRACDCYGADYYSPMALSQIRDTILGLLGALNHNMCQVSIEDKGPLIEKFNKKLEESQQSLNKIELLKKEFANLQ